MKKTYKLALFGDPVDHSLSPKIHNKFADEFQIFIDYKLIQVKPNQLADELRSFFENGGTGCNITLPHKTHVISTGLLENLTDRACAARAVNTIYKGSNSGWIGDNTDGIGFVRDIEQHYGFDPLNKRILILGAGGAVSSVFNELMKRGSAKICVANRSLEKAEIICKNENSVAIELNQLKSVNETFDLIIHASSLGHQGDCLKFFAHQIHQNTVAYDLSYGKAAEPFMEYCRRHHLNQCMDGMGMLIHQAAFAFQRWFSVMPNTQITL